MAKYRIPPRDPNEPPRRSARVKEKVDQRKILTSAALAEGQIEAGRITKPKPRKRNTRRRAQADAQPTASAEERRPEAVPCAACRDLGRECVLAEPSKNGEDRVGACKACIDIGWKCSFQKYGWTID